MSVNTHPEAGEDGARDEVRRKTVVPARDERDGEVERHDRSGTGEHERRRDACEDEARPSRSGPNWRFAAPRQPMAKSA